MTEGFLTALGTPLDKHGNYMAASMAAHVESQLAAGAAGLLCMGSMGQQPYIANSQYPLVARTCADTVRGGIPLYVGVSDISIQRVTDRIEALKGLAVDGVVATASYYEVLTQEELVSFYRQIADNSPYPLYLYDLPYVSRAPVTPETVLTLMCHPNILGIKSANITMLRRTMRHPSFDPAFRVFFSGLDIADVGFCYGLSYILDGMFACAPVTSAAFGRCLAAGDVRGAGITLDRILNLRDTMDRFGLWSSFTYIMNRLGFPGYFNPDYVTIRDDGREVLDALLKEMGEVS